jgi:N-acetylglucosaminyldiphosphoundecaprenol N-acetyl-beta-D-mannosaminyltransferase
MDQIQIFNFKIDTLISPLKLNKSKIIINTINPHCYCETKYDLIYKESLQRSDLLIPDGIGIVWAVRILTGKKIHRIAGADIHQHLLELLDKNQGKVFYMGSAPPTLKRIEERVTKEYPNVNVASYSPPYKPEFTKEENRQIIDNINAFQPDVVFVGMTAPKQEKWSYQNRDLLNTKVIASIGAVFDFYAGTVKRPGKFWYKLGLEWLPRLLREPKRLWRRNFISTPCFLWDVFKAKIGWLKFD